MIQPEFAQCVFRRNFYTQINNNWELGSQFSWREADVDKKPVGIRDENEFQKRHLSF